MSVHASTRAVWFHSWHGEFVEMSDPDPEQAPTTAP